MPLKRSAQLMPPALATRVDAVPVGAGWLHEPKFDGYRLQCHVEDGLVSALTRSGLDWGERFPDICSAVKRLAGKRHLVLDGEVVMPARDDRSPFQTLQTAVRDGNTERAIYWVFDLLVYDRLDLRSLSLTVRRDSLHKLLRAPGVSRRIRLTPELRGAPAGLLAQAHRKNSEGVISKRRDGAYPSGRSNDWLKAKVSHSDEFVVVGFTAPNGARESLGALLLATREHGTGLRYAGRVGSGMTAAELVSLARQLSPSSTPSVAVPSEQLRGVAVTWVEPALVVSVGFAEWTNDGLLRQATLLGVREDKVPVSVRRERAEVMQSVSISHGERVVYPEIGLTKADIAAYYGIVAPLLIPHIEERPLSLMRCPDGAHGACFFQKHWSLRRGEHVTTRAVIESDGESEDYAFVSTASELLALVQMNVIEIHPWGSRLKSLERPDMLILDLDPGPGVSWNAVRDAAFEVRRLLEFIGLTGWLKLSGGKGLHIGIPIERRLTWDQASQFCRLLAERMAADHPKSFVVKSTKSIRTGRIFIDWMRNSRGATAVAPWSMRARPGAPISMPIEWEDLAFIARGDDMTVPTVIDYLRSRPADPWHKALSTRQRVSAEMVGRLSGATE